MKPKHIAIVAALAVIVVQSAPAGSLPEFMTREQLRAMRAGQIARAAADRANVAKSETPTLYTGKISDADSGGYLFKYRNYDPEMNRWTTVDPSGFPDGANSLKYVDAPTSELDQLGLWTTAQYVQHYFGLMPGYSAGSTIDMGKVGDGSKITTHTAQNQQLQRC